MNQHDNITNPKHYDLTPRPADVIYGWRLSYWKASAIKYISRAGRKDGVPEVTDLQKAVQCLQLEIERLERAASGLELGKNGA